MTAQIPLLLADPRQDHLRALLQEELAWQPRSQTVLSPGCSLPGVPGRQLPIAELLPRLGELAGEHIEEMISFCEGWVEMWPVMYLGWRLAAFVTSLDGIQFPAGVEWVHCRCADRCGTPWCSDIGSQQVWRVGDQWGWRNPLGEGLVPLGKTAFRLARACPRIPNQPWRTDR